ncbi:MAG: hypothetical protein QOI34_495 [Verrucomicrobiota bacterium]
MFGFTQDEAVGHSLAELVIPPDRVEEEQRIRRGARDGEVAVYESVRRRKDGSLMHVSVSTKAIRDNISHELQYFISTKKDVTHLKVLRDSKLVEARFRDLIESTSDAIVMVNAAGRIVLVNSHAEKVFGHKKAEIMGRPIDILLPERYRFSGSIADPANLFAHSNGGPMSAGSELYGLRKSGEEFPIQISLSPLETEEGTMIMSAIRDISDRRKAEQKFCGLLESAPDAMVIVNAACKIVLVNSQTVKLFGWNREELLKQKIEMLVPERFRDAHPGDPAGLFTTPKARATDLGMELRGLRKDGSEFPIEVSLNPLETEEQLFVIRDVTERKRFEQTLQEKNVEMRKAILARDRFLASMSHELRTPLNAIIGFTGTLLMGLPGPLTAEQKRQLETVRSSARHQLSLINDLLDLAKIESGKVELNFEQIDCADVVNEVADTLGPLAIKKGLRFEVRVPKNIVVNIDRRAFSQILINLVNNAIKFTNQGVIRLRVQKRNGATEVSVTDTGIGITREDQAGLFDAFSRSVSANGNREEGSGLGLHLSQRLAELIGARINFKSKRGKGSFFAISLQEQPA